MMMTIFLDLMTLAIFRSKDPMYLMVIGIYQKKQRKILVLIIFLTLEIKVLLIKMVI